MAHDIDNEIETQSELVAWLAAERKKLQDRVDWHKANVEKLIAERNQAKKEYPQMIQDLGIKKALAERLPKEIRELEQRIADAEFIKDDDETRASSYIKQARQDYERAVYQMKSLVSTKMERAKKAIQGGEAASVNL